ncbi:MAG TPA: cytochrome D1 domain-containing protein [Blastocatellia bacterium]|nr:cytochrome D1 domain-containing protein [Blastocatellia bacterium]
MKTATSKTKRPRGPKTSVLSNSGRLGLATALLLTVAIIAAAGVPQSKSIATDQTKPGSDEKPASASSSSREPQRIVHEGLVIDFSVEPVSARGGKATALIEGDDATVRFKMTDSRTGTPLTNLHPSAWMDRRAAGKTTEGKDCRQKIQSFLQSSLSSRPDMDLNIYYILTLNQEANISVIDPLLGYGSSKLLTLVFLKSPGEDWVMSRDKKWLFVTMPLVNQLAVVDTSNWKVLTNIDAGPKPSKIALQPDDKYLWVGNDAADGESGVTAIDSSQLKVAAHIKTGAGHHEIAFAGDSRYAYVTNKLDGTLSVIDVQKLSRAKDIKTGPLPVSLAFSALSNAIYVAGEEDGTIAVIGGEIPDILARIKTKPGVRSIRFAPDGRYGFVVNGKDSNVHVFDASSNRLLHAIDVGKNPDKISFTRGYAYVRALGSDQVNMIRLEAIGKPGEVPVIEFPAGQLAPEKSSSRSLADPIVATPEGESVLVANPADKMIYYYAEGMAAPMGSFQNYRREPRAVMVWDQSLRETSPGVYSTNVKLVGSGDYDVAFLLDTPRVSHCFDLSVAPNLALKKEPEVPIYVEPLITDSKIKVGETIKLQFLVVDSKSRLPKDGLKDLGVLVFLAPGQSQNRLWAQSIGDGKYEVSFKPAQAGPYYVFVHCPSLRVGYNQTIHFILQAVEAKPATPATPSK